MFEERDHSAFAKKGKDGKTPYIVNLHTGIDESPYEWIVDNGKDEDGNTKQYKIRNIKFFFCVKHNNSGKIESHMWFFKGF
jgi:cellulose synthase/poly-beta-1,6-N-acetylglucosamine synthase-like glycosyltransferase